MKMTKEIKIALAAVLAIVILFFGLNFLKGLTMFSSNNVYYVAFDDISGLSSSSPIYANGYQVGVVTSIKYDYTHQSPTLAVIDVDKNMRIPKGSTAEIESDMLGNLKLNLHLGPDPLSNFALGDTLEGRLNGGTMAKLSAMMPTVEQMLPKLDSIVTSLNTLLADPAIAQTLHNVENVTADLKTSTARLNTLMANVNQQLPSLMSKADATLDNATTLTSSLAGLDIAATKAQVDQTLADVNALTSSLASGKGTLGRLMNDTELYDRVSQTVNDADQLLVDLKQHPKRYVNISVFGKKDK
ncbi:MAG: MCE family protein [Prevotella sp.]|nr:MCE family protein [Prevotella sp.]